MQPSSVESPSFDLALYLPMRPPTPAMLPNMPAKLPKDPRVLSPLLLSDPAVLPVSMFMMFPRLVKLPKAPAALPTSEPALPVKFAMPVRMFMVLLMLLPRVWIPLARVPPTMPVLLGLTTFPAAFMTLPTLLVNSLTALPVLTIDEMTLLMDVRPLPVSLMAVLTLLDACICKWIFA